MFSPRTKKWKKKLGKNVLFLIPWGGELRRRNAISTHGAAVRSVAVIIIVVL